MTWLKVVIGLLAALVLLTGIFVMTMSEESLSEMLDMAAHLVLSEENRDMIQAGECRGKLAAIGSAKVMLIAEKARDGEYIPFDKELQWPDLVPKYLEKPLKCSKGGIYKIGTLNETPQCSIGGNDTVLTKDDHAFGSVSDKAGRGQISDPVMSDDVIRGMVNEAIYRIRELAAKHNLGLKKTEIWGDYPYKIKVLTEMSTVEAMQEFLLDLRDNPHYADLEIFRSDKLEEYDGLTSRYILIRIRI